MPEEHQNELSGRELEILKLVATGASNKEIAQQLFISSNTVKVHIRNIFTKIGAASRTEAAMYAVRIGLVENISPSLRTEENEYKDEEITATVITNNSSNEISQKIEPGNRRSIIVYIGLSVVVITLIIFGIIFIPKSFDQGNAPAVSTMTPQVQWFELSGPPTPRKGLAVVNYGNILYTIGGEDLKQITGIVETYDPQTHLWTTQSSKPTPVADINAAVIGGLIYIPGGRLSSGMPTNVTEIYNPQQDQWTKGISLPKALSAYSLAVYEGKIYLFGGWDGQQVTNEVFTFDPAKNSWSENSPMPIARSSSGAVLVGNKIYVVGGWDGHQALTVNEVFQPESLNLSSVWSEAPPLHTGRYAMGIANIADIIFIIGGNTASDDSAAIAFVPEETDWGDVANPITNNWTNLGATNIGSRLYALGGMVNNELSNQMWSYKVLFSIVLPILPK